MELWTALLLGFVGSAHCAGMCGPLAMALPGTADARGQFVLGRLAYNGGRILTYVLLGALFGVIGQIFALAGLGRWVSLILGTVILLSLLFTSRFAGGIPALPVVHWLKSALAAVLRRHTLPSLFTLGLLNGLLPCGLVYFACAGATATSSLLSGMGYMLAFGLGTLPMMLGISLAGARVQFGLRLKLQRLIPVSLAIVGVLLLLRGMALGIPYLSPDLETGQGQCCHVD